jgi:hypothetical protein
LSTASTRVRADALIMVTILLVVQATGAA